MGWFERSKAVLISLSQESMYVNPNPVLVAPWRKITIIQPKLQMYGKIALGLGHNSTLSHRLFWTLRIDYKLRSYQLTFEKCVLWSLSETSRVEKRRKTKVAKFLSRPVTTVIQTPKSQRSTIDATDATDAIDVFSNSA
jgi:hypothetical protein